ncbi:MAG: hypothetical protein HC814_00595 [Rhodobacteraceae bacterium]|nr:hypothetical protein [Paracoccaceae bacterium]
MLAGRDLVASAVGFDEQRGDVITIKSMSLQSVSPQGTEVTRSVLDGVNIDLMSGIQMLVLAVVTLILGLFVIRPLLSRDPQPVPNQIQALPGAAQGGSLGAEGNDFALPELPMLSEFDEDFDALPNLNGKDGMSEDPVARLRMMIGDRQEETVEILRSWLEEKEENA